MKTFFYINSGSIDFYQNLFKIKTYDSSNIQEICDHRAETVRICASTCVYLHINSCLLVMVDIAQHFRIAI